MAEEPLGEPIIIRFDGLDADRHELEIFDLSEALAGLSRIIAASSHFALTQEVSLRKNAQIVKIVSRAPKDGSYTIEAFVQYAHHHPMFGTYAIATTSALTGSLIGYIIKWAVGREEMRAISQALELSIRQLGSRDQPTIDRLLTTVEKMAENLRPAVRRAVAPVGHSARTLTVGLGDEQVVVDEADKAAIMSPAGLTVAEEESYTVLISELDMQTGSCHVAIENDELDRRFPAKITDPAALVPKNPYVMAMAAKASLAVRAKATYRDGEIERFYISNFEDRPRGEPDFGLI